MLPSRPPAWMAGLVLVLGLLAGFVRGGEPSGVRPAPAFQVDALALKKIRVPAGLKIEVFAAEPLLANPVTFCIDEKGRFYVAETYRMGHGVTDTRGHMAWLDDDLACRTVEDRVAMFRKYQGKEFQPDDRAEDRVTRVEDRDGDGRADHATVFAGGFHNIPDGIGAGVLARRGTVWYTCIPDLWRLKDTNDDGVADHRESLHRGFGVHVGFIGHDLHGLKFGPDGKLYFSIGDRGLNVRAGGRTIALPDTGAVLRCNPDGSELEVFATGLRNPQELAFDRFGNLFTADNNSDSGDRARWVYLIEGGDSGWRIGYQFMEQPVSRGPWNAEKLWYPRWDGQAAYLVPPLANLGDGPSGLAYNPGTGLNQSYQDHFFLADFRGTADNSGIRSFAVKPRGASFELIDSKQFAWSIAVTDVDFGYDGALYCTDWVEGWDLPGKGRIYRIFDPSRAGDPRLRETRRLIAEGMTGRPLDELARLLGHPDMRVRQEAQFALADKGGDARATLERVARRGDDRMARLHAIWGLGQIGRRDRAALATVLDLLRDPDEEVRAQAAKVLGDDRDTGASKGLVALLADSSLHVRSLAAISLGKLGDRAAVAPVLRMLRENNDRDPFLRHAGVMALVGIGDRKALRGAADDGSAAVRTAVLLADRRLKDPEVARFLDDRDPRVVLEAARAIYDVPIPEGLPRLAALVDRKGLAEPLLYRALNANFRLGAPANAAAVAAVAARRDVPTEQRYEAIDELASWARPSGRDRVLGLWRPLPERPANGAADALRPVLAGLLRDAPDRVRRAAIHAAGALKVREAGPMLFTLLNDKDQWGETRAEALRALDRIGDPRLSEAVRLAVADANPRLREQGHRLLAKVDPKEALGVLRNVLERGSDSERQNALAILGEMPRAGADAVLAQWLDRDLAGQVPPRLRLDLLEAAARRPAPEVRRKLAAIEARRDKGDPLGRYRECLEGGDAAQGRKTFFEDAAVSCLRCHKVRGTGGEVGPDLSDVGKRQKREYLLESIVAPNRQIAQGFESVVVATSDGQVHTGVLKGDDGKVLRLMTAEGKPVTIPKDEIEEQKRGPSAMPDDLVKQLSKSQIRDLVEFLANLK